MVLVDKEYVVLSLLCGEPLKVLVYDNEIYLEKEVKLKLAD